MGLWFSLKYTWGSVAHVDMTWEGFANGALVTAARVNFSSSGSRFCRLCVLNSRLQFWSAGFLQNVSFHYSIVAIFENSINTSLYLLQLS